MIRVSTWIKPHKSKGRVFSQPSPTLPDDSLSIKEILTNFTRHNHTGLRDNGAVYDETEQEDISTMDIVEKHEYLKEVSENVDTLKTKYKKLTTKPEPPKPEPPKDSE